MSNKTNLGQEFIIDFSQKLEMLERYYKPIDDAKREENKRLGQECLEENSLKENSIAQNVGCLNTESQHHQYTINISFSTDKDIIHAKRLLTEIKFKLKSSDSLYDDGVKNVDGVIAINKINEFGHSVPWVIDSSF